MHTYILRKQEIVALRWYNGPSSEFLVAGPMHGTPSLE